jgi:hypothetical protein
MNKTLLITEVAALARDMERLTVLSGNRSTRPASVLSFGISKEKFDAFVIGAQDDEGSETMSSKAGVSTRSLAVDNQPTLNEQLGRNEFIIDPNGRDALTGSLNQSQKMRIVELLGNW